MRKSKHSSAMSVEMHLGILRLITAQNQHILDQNNFSAEHKHAKDFLVRKYVQVNFFENKDYDIGFTTANFGFRKAADQIFAPLRSSTHSNDGSPRLYHSSHTPRQNSRIANFFRGNRPPYVAYYYDRNGVCKMILNCAHKYRFKTYHRYKIDFFF